MTQWIGRNRRGLLLAGLLVAAGPGLVSAQTPAAAMSFEVATIRPSDPNKVGGMLFMSRDKFETGGQTLKAIMKFAYGLNFGGDQQISGGPSWIGSAKFDIEAKEDAETVAALQKLPAQKRSEQVRLMVQTLLADRFKLKIHHENRELPVYVMTVVKSGLKMTPSAVVPAATSGAAPTQSWSGLRRIGKGQMEGKNASPELLGNVLGMQPEISGRMVLDKTGLKGTYDFMLKWTPDAGMAAGGDAGAATDASGPSLFTALQEELGLRVDATKSPVDTIVIDSVEMPSEN